MSILLSFESLVQRVCNKSFKSPHRITAAYTFWFYIYIYIYTHAFVDRYAPTEANVFIRKLQINCCFNFACFFHGFRV